MIPHPQGRPVYALHCSGMSGRQWRTLGETLAPVHRLVAPDLPGHGRAPGLPRSAVPGLAHYAEPVIAQMERERTPVHLVGHSLGAAVALKIATIRPDLVASLALYEPVAFTLLANSPAAGDREEYAGIRGLARMVENNPPLRAMGAFVDFWHGPGTWRLIDEAAQQRQAASVASIRNDFRAIFAEAWPQVTFRRLTMPALVMTGLESPVLTQRISEILAMALPSAELALLPEAGHMGPVCESGQVIPRLHRHIAIADRGAGPTAPLRRAA